MPRLEFPHLLFQSRPTRSREDDAVPQALEWEDNSASNVEPIARPLWMDKRINAIDTAGGPGDENG